jgi:hypothetical protein
VFYAKKHYQLKMQEVYFYSYIVIFEDLNRLSRDIQVHSLLKAEFKKR